MHRRTHVPIGGAGARRRLADEPARRTTCRGLGEPVRRRCEWGHVICDPRGQGCLPGLWRAPDSTPPSRSARPEWSRSGGGRSASVGGDQRVTCLWQLEREMKGINSEKGERDGNVKECFT